MEEILNVFMENMIGSVEGLIGLSVTDVNTGESYEAYSSDSSFDAKVASAYNLEVVRAKIAAIKALGLEEEIEEISIVLSSQIHIINISPSKTYFIYMAVDSSKANIGIARGLLKKHKKDLNEMI